MTKREKAQSVLLWVQGALAALPLVMAIYLATLGQWEWLLKWVGFTAAVSVVAIVLWLDSRRRV